MNKMGDDFKICVCVSLQHTRIWLCDIDMWPKQKHTKRTNVSFRELKWKTARQTESFEFKKLSLCTVNFLSSIDIMESQRINRACVLRWSDYKRLHNVNISPSLFRSFSVSLKMYELMCTLNTRYTYRWVLLFFIVVVAIIFSLSHFS